MNLRGFQKPLSDYDHLSLKELLEAQDLYHIHLMHHPHVVATALGRYRIRCEDSWPDENGTVKKHGNGERTLENSEVRPYSWPCILAFVDEWIPATQFGEGNRYDPEKIVPKTLYLPDGRRVPVCVIKAPRQLESNAAPPTIRYPLNNLGGGRPVVAQVQGQEHVATIACLVRDGHKVYALTNRHVTGEVGEVLYSYLGGKLQRIGVTAAKQLTRLPFMDLYPGFLGRNAYVNLDIGMIDIDDLDRWTAQIQEVGTMGPLADYSVDNLSLALIGCHVRGYGSASGSMAGEIHGLFYRYKSQGGFEYLADFLIGPRSGSPSEKGEKKGKGAVSFATHPGDSGTLWLLESRTDVKDGQHNGHALKRTQPEYLPLAMQWGAHLLFGGGASPQSYALATCLSTVCNLLEVDPVRDWNLDQPDTWGAVGHFSIASRVTSALSDRFPQLKALMKANLSIIAPNDDTILHSKFKGMGSEDFVHLADVPDFFWKHGKQGHSRHFEGPNHFADMDQKRPDDDEDLLSLCRDEENVDPKVWNDFYDSVHDILTGEPIAEEHRGLLPFRVWQIFDEMVEFARKGDAARFACAAGILTHYVGDACQPLHISYLHDGDPDQPVTRKVHHRDGSMEEVRDPLGKGVHSAYEDDMVNTNRAKILAGLDKTPEVEEDELIEDGFSAASKTIKLMSLTFDQLPPRDIVDAFVQFQGPHRARADFFWKKFGTRTIKAMQAGTHLLAVLWESAWRQGDGENNISSKEPLTPEEAMTLCADRSFLESMSIGQIGAKLERRTLHAHV